MRVTETREAEVVYKYVPPYTSRTVFASGLTTPAAITFNALDLLVSETSLDDVIKIRPNGAQGDFLSPVTTPLGLLANGTFVYIVYQRRCLEGGW